MEHSEALRWVLASSVTVAFTTRLRIDNPSSRIVLEAFTWAVAVWDDEGLFQDIDVLFINSA
ncbi:hypothetical protein IMZ48_25370 [Candidatus Bathyarchaeota archaeon]|nr:hypothetical protein [Candidatus Bathyarchaeota archaeon]